MPVVDIQLRNTCHRNLNQGVTDIDPPVFVLLGRDIMNGPPQTLNSIQQYQSALELCTRNLLATRQALERQDLPAGEKDRLQKQEQTLQQQISLCQNMLNQAQQQQQLGMAQMRMSDSEEIGRWG